MQDVRNDGDGSTHRAPLRFGTRVGIAVACGLTVAIVARAFAGASCTGPDSPAFASTCSGLVASLSTRLGVVVGVVVLLVGLVGTGILRAAEDLEARRAHDERGDR
jgi:hypothetical protein